MSTPPVPTLTPFAHIEVEVGEAVDLGRIATGHRRMIPLLGGVVSGSIGNGVVVDGGADWQRIHDDGTVSLDAQYVLQLEDGTAIEVESRGIRTTSDEGVYFRTAIRFTAPASRADVNQRLFVSAGIRLEHRVILDVYEIS